MLFGLLAAIQVGLLGVHVWLAMGHGVAWTLVGVAAVFVAWVLVMAGVWRLPQWLAGDYPAYGAVSEDGVRGFGLPAGVMLGWREVDRAVLVHQRKAPGTREVGPIAAFALVEGAGYKVWIPREAFVVGGWILPQQFLEGRCGAAKVTRNDRLAPRFYANEVDPGMVLLVFACGLPLWALALAAGEWAFVGLLLVIPLLVGAVSESARCRLTVLAIVGQLVAGGVALLVGFGRRRVRI